MDAKIGKDEGVTVLDGAALVSAAAVASVHMKSAVGSASSLGWGLAWIAFAGVALTSAGPFVYLVRRYGRRPAGYPRLGDRLWALLGVPWLVAAPLQSSGGSWPPGDPGLYPPVLTMGVAAVSLVVLVVMWKTWVLTPPAAREPGRGPAPWTARLGMALAVAWPLQCGFLLVVLDSPGSGVTS